MPKRAYTSGYSRRPAKRQRRAGPALATSVPRGLSIPGKSHTAVVLNYTDMQSLNGGVGTVGGHNYKLNSLFDPDDTGVGEQPSGYDQYVALYNRYTVFKADVEVMFSSASSATESGSYSAGMFVSQNAYTGTALTDNLARSDKLVFGAASGGGQTTQKMRMTYYFPAIAGKRYRIGDTEYSANSVSSPTNLIHLRVWAGAADDVQDAAIIRCLIRIRFYAVFSEPRSLDES